MSQWRSPCHPSLLQLFSHPQLLFQSLTAVIHESCSYSQRLHMDSEVAEFLGVHECSYFRDTDFSKYDFGQEGFNPMLHFLVIGQKMSVRAQR